MTKDYRKLFNTLDKYLKDKVEDIDNTILQALEDRKNGKICTFSEHLRGFIYAQLSALVSWKKIKSNLENIDNIFCQFDVEKLKLKSAEDLIAEITEIKCNNPYTTKNQMRSLKANIETFEKIEKDFSSIDNFITCHSPKDAIKLLTDTNSTYKLKYSGVALVCEYLRNMGMDIVKPDVHLKRILAPDRLNLVSLNSDYAVIEKCKQLSYEIGISQIKIDYLLWNYCAKGYGEVCTKKPKCEKCVIREYCKKEVNMSVIEEIEQFLSSMPLNHEFSRKWFKTELSKQFNRSEDSYIPSDYCYNRTNKGVKYDRQPHYFLHIGRGKYKYVGKNYQFNGDIEQYPKNK